MTTKGVYLRDGVRYRAGRRLWTDADDAVLRARYATEPSWRLARELGRDVGGIYQRANTLGLAKDAAYLAGPYSGRLRPDHNQGGATRFQSGQVPANKGLRRPGWAPGRMRETQFKPGERRGVAAKNWCPIGTIKTDSEGYQRIKVREAVKGEAYGFGNTRVWPLLNRHLWEQAHGPIPPGCSVVFKDGNRANCVIENLTCVPRRELMARNTIHNLPKPIAHAAQLLGALKRQIRERERHVEAHD